MSDFESSDLNRQHRFTRKTYSSVAAARKEQEARHKEQMEMTSAIKDAVDREGRRAVLDWLTPVDYANQQADFIN